MQDNNTTLILQILICIRTLAVCILPCALVLALIKFMTKVPDYVFRKLMHTVAFGSAIIMIMTAESWVSASITFFLGAILSYPVLGILENAHWYEKLLVQKGKGEVRKSLFLFYLMAAVLTAVVWGIFRQRIVAAAAILMWGAGDAAAALIGIPFGKHKIKLSDGKKSWEGSFAMFAVSFLCGALMLLPLQKTGISMALATSLFAAIAATAAELLSPGDYDNIIIPVAAAVMLMIGTGL